METKAAVDEKLKKKKKGTERSGLGRGSSGRVPSKCGALNSNTSTPKMKKLVSSRFPSPQVQVPHVSGSHLLYFCFFQIQLSNLALGFCYLPMQEQGSISPSTTLPR
jgi:hypothetical protein